MAIISLLCARDKEDNISDPNKNIVDLITTNYLNEQLDKINTYDGTINQLNSEFPIQCLRTVKSEYQAVYRGDQKLLIIVFGLNGDKVLSKIYNVSKISSIFDGLTAENTLDEIQKLDPLSDYTFLYTGRNDIACVSYYCTYDGYMIQISYNDNNAITAIEKTYFDFSVQKTTPLQNMRLVLQRG